MAGYKRPLRSSSSFASGKFFFIFALPGNGSSCSRAGRTRSWVVEGPRAFAPMLCENLDVVALSAGTILLLVLREWNNEDVAGAVGVLWKWCGADGALIRQCGQEVAQTSLLRSGGMMKLGRGAVGLWERVWRIER